MIGVASLLIVVTLGLMITRVAAVALRTTGLSTDRRRLLHHQEDLLLQGGRTE